MIYLLKIFENFLYLLKDKSKDWRENNFRFNKEIFDFIHKFLEKNDFEKNHFLIISSLVVEKLSEAKFTEGIFNITKKSVENLGHKLVLNQLISLTNNSTNPKSLIELCNLFGQMAEKNSKNIFQKELIEFAKMCANHSTQSVRSAAISLFKILYKNLGKLA